MNRRVSNSRKAFKPAGKWVISGKKGRSVWRERRFFEEYVGKARRVPAPQESSRVLQAPQEDGDRAEGIGSECAVDQGRGKSSTSGCCGNQDSCLVLPGAKPPTKSIGQIRPLRFPTAPGSGPRPRHLGVVYVAESVHTTVNGKQGCGIGVTTGQAAQAIGLREKPQPSLFDLRRMVVVEIWIRREHVPQQLKEAPSLLSRCCTRKKEGHTVSVAVSI